MRWLAVVTYRTEAGPLEVPLDFDEIHELDDMIERGPHFGAIEQIVIRYAFQEHATTVEAAEDL